MILRNLLTLSRLLLPIVASAHKSKTGRRVPSVGIADRGELIFDNDKFGYKSQNNVQLPGRVRTVQHIAGRISAKEKNATLVKAIKATDLPHNKYQIITIVNMDNAIPDFGMFVRDNLESNKKLYPWSQFVANSDDIARKAWQLSEENSAIVVLGRDGRVQRAEDGVLTQEEVQQVITLLHKLLSK